MLLRNTANSFIYDTQAKLSSALHNLSHKRVKIEVY